MKTIELSEKELECISTSLDTEIKRLELQRCKHPGLESYIDAKKALALKIALIIKSL